MNAKPANVVCEGGVCYMVPEGAQPPAPAAASSSSSALSVLLGDTLKGKAGDVPLSSVTGKGKILALYFSGKRPQQL